MKIIINDESLMMNNEFLWKKFIEKTRKGAIKCFSSIFMEESIEKRGEKWIYYGKIAWNEFEKARKRAIKCFFSIFMEKSIEKSHFSPILLKMEEKRRWKLDLIRDLAVFSWKKSFFPHFIEMEEKRGQKQAINPVLAVFVDFRRFSSKNEKKPVPGPRKSKS